MLTKIFFSLQIPTSGFEVSAHTSGALTRDPVGVGEDFVRGSVTQVPFMPGGMEDAYEEKNRFLNLTPEELEKGFSFFL